MSFDIIIPFLKPIERLLESPTVSEIMVNPDAKVWMEENGQKHHLPDVRFEEGALNAGLEVIANRFGKKLDADSPILNLRLPDGSRLAAIIPPVVNPRPLLTIRKFTFKNVTIDDLVNRGMMTAELAGTLAERVRRGDNILIAGATASGKTTTISVLADFIPEDERILVIEDTAELHIRKPHVVSAESQTDTHRGSVTFDDLLRAILRHTPDRIIVGEIRGIEAMTLLDAMNTGHRGMLATIHAGSAEDAIPRLATLAMRANVGLSLAAVEAEIRRHLDLIVYISRRHGKRVIDGLLELPRRA